MEAVIETFAAAFGHHRAGRYREAETLYRSVLRIDPNHADAVHLLGVTALQQGRYSEAVEHMERAIALSPGNAELYCNLAAAHRAGGDFDLAIENYQRALDINPELAGAHNNLGNALREKGDTHSAEQSYRRALEIDPGFEVARENLESAGCSRVSETEPQVRAADTGVRIVLHVGCGPANPRNLHERFRGPDWKEVRLDIDPGVRPDIVASLTDMHGVARESVDAVWSSHNLEHLYAHEVPLALGEFLRVLKAGGIALITMPDLQQIAEFVVANRLEETMYESPAGPISARDCLFGLGAAIASGNTHMAHRTGFTAKSLERHLKEAGFTDVRTWFSPFALWGEARKRTAAAV